MFWKTLKKAREDKLIPEEKRKEYRAARRQFENPDKLAERVTTAPGVSNIGIEVRRGDPKQKGAVSHGYQRVFEDPQKHIQQAKRLLGKSNLAKAPIENYDSSIGKEVPEVPIKERYETSAHSVPVADNIYHHALFSKRNKEALHMLSNSSNPFDKNATIYSQLVGDTSQKTGSPLVVQLSQVHPEHKGMGHGRALYEFALQHHGELHSDELLSPKAEGVYQHLKSKGAKVSFGKPDTRERHRVKTQPGFVPSIKPQKLAASEDKTNNKQKTDKTKKMPDFKSTVFKDPWDQAKHEREKEDLHDHLEISDENLDKAESKEVDIDPISSQAKFGNITRNSSGKIKKGSRLTATSLYRHYKHSPHHPVSLGLKYIIHRIENQKAYENADDATRDAYDKKFIEFHQQGKAGEKNGHVKVSDLRDFYNKNPHLPKQLLAHKEKLLDSIRAFSPEKIKTINGEEHVALTRGLNTEKPGEDHALASYADAVHTGFGTHMHYRYVPLKNLWYSYDLGKVAGTSKKFGNEKEYLVSPHKTINAQKKDVEQLVPRNLHSYDKNVDFSNFKHGLFFAKKPNTSPEILHNLHRNKDPSVREAVAQNPNTSPETLHSMSQDKYPPVLVGVAKHPNTSSETLHNLHQHENPHIRHAVARHPNTSPETLHSMSQDENYDIREAVAKHPNTSPETLHNLHQDEREYVRRAVAEHPNFKNFSNKLAASEKTNKKNNLSKAQKLEHYSKKPGLQTIDPSFQGTGVDVQIRANRMGAHPHSFFYLAGTEPEHIVRSGAKSKYSVDLPETHKVYDIGTDPEKLIENLRSESMNRQTDPGVVQMDDIHSAIKNAGYSGFKNSKHDLLPNVVALYHKVPVSSEEKI